MPDGVLTKVSCLVITFFQFQDSLPAFPDECIDLMSAK
jgi:hypothetical protein